MYTSMSLTTREALDIAKREHPADLVARCAFLRDKADTSATVGEQACWLEALARTRGSMSDQWDGYEIIQRGRIVISPDEALAREAAGEPRFTFADRAQGLDVSLVRSGDTLLENKGEWIHMRATT